MKAKENPQLPGKDAEGAVAGMSAPRTKAPSVFTEAGLSYSFRGWKVFPVNQDKKPVCKWTQEATRDRQAIQRLFSRSGAEGIAIVTGPESGLLVLDIDCKNIVDGNKSLQELENTLGPLPETLKQRTGSGGYHLFFQYPDGVVIKNSAGKLGPGIDVRGQGGYVVVSPSHNQSGPYEWLNDLDPAPLPQIFADWLAESPKPKPNASPPILSSSTSRYGQRALVHECQAVATASKGQRNDILNTAALKIGQLVGGGEIAESDAIQALKNAATTCGLPERESDKTINSGLNKGMAEPRQGITPRTGDENVRNNPMVSLTPTCELDEWQPISKPWPKLSSEALPGIVGDFVYLATRDSEADPAAVLATFLVRMGVAVGGPTKDKRPHLFIGETRHEPRIFGVICGQSSKARKGTSASPVLRLFSVPKESLICPSQGLGGMSEGPLSSGEGIVYAVRDEIREWNEKDQVYIITDPGIEDKRLFVLEEEFAAALNAGKRDGNTLSATIRTLFDNGNRSPLTKTARTSCSGAHVGICAHITLDELHIALPGHDLLNGYANRFLWVLAKRQRRVPMPSRMPDKEFSDIQLWIFQRIATAHEVGQMRFDDPAISYWKTIYNDLSEDVPGVVGSVTARAEAQVVRLAIIYALCDQANLIAEKHIKAAQSFWDYCKESAKYIFGDVVLNKLDLTIKEIMAAKQEPISLSEIHAATGGNHKGDDIGAALQRLCDNGEVIHSRIINPTSGRPRNTYELTKIKGVQA